MGTANTDTTKTFLCELLLVASVRPLYELGRCIATSTGLKLFSRQIVMIRMAHPKFCTNVQQAGLGPRLGLFVDISFWLDCVLFVVLPDDSRLHLLVHKFLDYDARF